MRICASGHGDSSRPHVDDMRKNGNLRPLCCRPLTDGGCRGRDVRPLLYWAATEPGWGARSNPQRPVALTPTLGAGGEG